MSVHPPDGPEGELSDPVKRFTQRAGDYARFRPTYPAGAIDAILDGLGDPGSILAADIGAGTGIASVLLAERGCAVHAVEPNEPMRAKASPHERVTWHGGTGEATGLGDDSVSLVLCAQAFHWLDPARAMDEFARILQPGGKVVLMWNIHDVRLASMARYRDIILNHATQPPRSPWASPQEMPLETDARFEGYALREFRFEQVVDRDGLIGRAVSSSYLPREGAGRESLERALIQLFDDCRDEGDGLMRLVYRTEVHEARLRA